MKKVLNYIGDVCDYFTDAIQFLMPFFVVMACLKYLGLDWVILVVMAIAIYQATANFAHNELKRDYNELVRKRAILKRKIEILERLRDDEPTSKT